MDGGAWWAALHGVAKSWTRLSDFTFTFHFQALEKEMATHSSVLAWRIPGTGEPGGLPSMGSHRVGHDWSGLAQHLYMYPSPPFSYLRGRCALPAVPDRIFAVQLLGGVPLSTTLRTAACPAALSITVSLSFLKLKFAQTESVMPSNHLILCCPLLLLL